MPPSPPARRSTRGAPPAAPASTTSSSLSSNRQDRNARGGNHQKSATPRSLSSEDISEPPRRSQRSQAAHKDEDAGKADEAIDDADEEAVDDEEITRCICGMQEYPGPPLSEAFAGIPDAQAEDAGELFILCDGCTVWQHGGCVGIVAENLTPEKYFCEQCRPKQHVIGTDSRGYVRSFFLPHSATPLHHTIPALACREGKSRVASSMDAHATSLQASPRAPRTRMPSTCPAACDLHALRYFRIS